MSQLHEQPVATLDRQRTVERTIVGLLLASQPEAPWSMDELILELGGERTVTIDSIDRLHRSGIVHRCGDFVFASRTARALDEALH
ncbi:MAG: hypothetical protein ACYCU0_02420 [Solirubrobacteraceae bacterium]